MKYSTKVYALSKLLQVDLEHATDLIKCGDYDVYTDREADKACYQAIEEVLWAFNPWFLSEVTGIDLRVFEAIESNNQCENNNEIIKSLVKNMKALVTQAIHWDGRGHFLSRYNGDEVDVKYKNTTYYVYRNN